MEPDKKFDQLASDAAIQTTVAALAINGMKAVIVQNGEEAKDKVLAMLPKNAEVFTMTSMTLEAIGLDKEINESKRYDAVRPKLMAMDRNTQARELAKLGAAPDWVLGSVHAVTQDGHLIIASNTGSQLSAEAYAAGKVVFVVGTHKIVKNNDEGIRRIYEYSLPLEDKRALKVYGMHSAVNKILIINKEVVPERVTIVLVKERLGF